VRRSILAMVIGFGALVSDGRAVAEDRASAKVTLGEISATDARPGIGERFRSIVKSEFSRLTLTKPATKPTIMSVALLKVEAGEGERVRCVVSATLRGERAGDLHAILRGEASVLGGTVSTREQDAMRAAVRSTLSRLGEAVAAAK
jgi:hypothetical protein